MNLKSIETLLKLKNNRFIEIGVMYASFEDNKLNVQNCMVDEFEELNTVFMSELTTISISLGSLFLNEIKQDIENHQIKNLLNIGIEPYDKGFKVTLKSYYLDKYMTDIRDYNFRKTIDEVVNSIKALESNIEKHIDEKITQYVDLKEIG